MIADQVEDQSAQREALERVQAELVGAANAVFGPRPTARRGEGAKGRILRYLQAHLGREVYRDELAAISGIHEWARRLRELRVEDGYDIRTVSTGSYRLEKAEPDREVAARWRLAHQIRNQAGGARVRVGRLLEASVGAVVTREQIDYVARIREGSRRVRELRDEEGWPINSHIDEPELYPGEYRLLSIDPADRRDASQRLYPEDLRERVFQRDGYTCQVCKRNRDVALAAGDTRFYLEVHHKAAIADELAELAIDRRHDIDNLVTLCHRDHLVETAKLQAAKRDRRRRPSKPA